MTAAEQAGKAYYWDNIAYFHTGLYASMVLTTALTNYFFDPVGYADFIRYAIPDRSSAKFYTER